jgi:pyruvate dehydrogenase E1 component alpha subunit
MTYRTCGHYQNDPGTGYRSAEEISQWESASPVVRFEDFLSREHRLQATALREIQDAVFDEVTGALALALSDPEPSPSTLEQGVFV